MKKNYSIVSLFSIVLLVMMVVSCHQKPINTQKVYQTNYGSVFHTVYSMKYSSPIDLQEDILNELSQFDGCLSMFNDSSIITRVNRNDSTVVLNDWFMTVFNKGQEVSRTTHGAFDMTVAPLVNTWGFGFKKCDRVTPGLIDSIKAFVGYEKIKIINGKVVKEDLRVMLDASAIAKGFSCDVVGKLLDSKGIENYMVEIGGEIVAKGVNPDGKSWRIGIREPKEDTTTVSPGLVAVLSLENVGVATSGNYFNYYFKDGKKYAHTIDPVTGYPVQHSLLSATVIAKDCMTADAYATSFMVMGLEKSIEFIESSPDLEAYFIYSDENGENKMYFSSGMEKIILNNTLSKK